MHGCIEAKNFANWFQNRRTKEKHQNNKEEEKKKKKQKVEELEKKMDKAKLKPKPNIVLHESGLIIVEYEK